MKHTKAQSMPLNVIIIAIIALIVLAVIVAIFAGKISIFSKEASACKSKGGECKDIPSQGQACASGEASVGGLCGENQVCCIPI